MDYTNKDILHIKDANKTEYIKFRRLEEYKEKIDHAFFLRKGGVSEGASFSLNFRTRGKDTKENVEKNLEKILEALYIKETTVVKGLQAHTDVNVCIDKENKEKYNYFNYLEEEVDGLITDEKDTTLLITTADCTPIIFYDPELNVVSCVHSGWKGTVKKIYLKAVEQMQEKYGCKEENIICAIGPCIRKCCWTTKDMDLVDRQIVSVYPYKEEYVEVIDDIIHVDFCYVIKKELEKIGLVKENILDANICTCCNEEDFYSFRKVTMRGEKEYGTMATIVNIK